MNKEIHALENTPVDGFSVFLAGPTPRNKEVVSWRPEMIKLLREQGFTGDILIPEKKGDWLDYDYETQTRWEVEYLNKANLILFWVPREISNMPGFTTNIEFGEFMHSGKIILGYPHTAHKMRYMRIRASMHNIPVFYTREECVDFIIEKEKITLERSAEDGPWNLRT